MLLVESSVAGLGGFLARTVLVVARFHRSPQGNWGAPLPRVPSSVRGQMTSQTALTINHNWLVESVSPQMGRVSLAELRNACGRTDPASEGWPCSVSGTLCANKNPVKRLSSPGFPLARWSEHPTGVCGGPGILPRTLNSFTRYQVTTTYIILPRVLSTPFYLKSISLSSSELKPYIFALGGEMASAMLLSLRKERAVMLMFQAGTLRIERYSQANNSFI